MTPALFAGRRKSDSRSKPAPATAPTPVPEATPDPAATLKVGAAYQKWRAELIELGGASALRDVGVLGTDVLDLSKAHPSGIAQLYAGRATPLGNLIREAGALKVARTRARTVRAEADEFAARYGLPPTHLSIGVAIWTPAPDEETDIGASAAGGPVRLPVLLRPVTVRPRGAGEADIELQLEPSVEINPVLVRELRSHGALLDAQALAASCFVGSGFNPGQALDRIAQLGQAVHEGFTLADRLLVATFLRPGHLLVEDLDQLGRQLAAHEVVAALAGDEDSAERLAAQELPVPVPTDRNPETERGFGDLDPGQHHVLDVVASGTHAFVETAPGAPVAPTIAAVIADAAAHGRSVLYVPGHRRAAEAVVRRLRDAGLGNLVLDLAPRPAWQSQAMEELRAGLEDPLPVWDEDHVHTTRAALTERARQLSRYVTALHEPRAPWHVSPYDALQALATATSARPGPRTTVRLPSEVARSLIGPRRAQVSDQLRRAAELGAFRIGPKDTPWFGADITDETIALDVLERVDRMRHELLPVVREQMAEVAETTGLAESVSLNGWGEQLDMLVGIRAALDVFLPVVFEKSAADMVLATAPPAWRREHNIRMGAMLRRRLRKQARDLVRPGRPVADLHAALVHVQQQREIWIRWCPGGTWPRLPEGMARIDADYRRLRRDLDALAAVLPPNPDGTTLGSMPVDQLAKRLDRLADARSSLTTLPERTVLLRALHAAGLTPLLEDLGRRRPTAGRTYSDPEALDLVPAELELSWWSSVLEAMLREDPDLAGYDGAGLARLTAGYQELDTAHLATLPTQILRAAVTRARAAVGRYPDQAEALVELTGERNPALLEVSERCVDLAHAVRPCWIAGPMQVPSAVAPLPGRPAVDLVILDAVQHITVAQAVAAVVRGGQIVVVGDPVRAGADSIAAALAAILPTVALPADATARDPRLTAFLAEHGYAGLAPWPLPSVDNHTTLHVVDGKGMPVQGEQSVESVDAEVQAVVDLALEHAEHRPQESLAVLTVSARHAQRLREAIAGRVRPRSDLRHFFDPTADEPFVVADLNGAAGLSRDAVILSIGFGKTPHGRVLHNFGVLGEGAGRALLLDALLALRHRLTVVSCFDARDLDAEKLRTEGAKLLADLLEFAAQPPGPRVGDEGTPDTLLLDLAERLWRRGLNVLAGYGLPGGLKVPLAIGHPDEPEEMLVAVLSDDEAFVAEESMRVRARLRAARLERLGWKVAQVWSAAVFLDPDAQAERIEQLTADALAMRQVAWLGRVPRETLR